MKEKKRREGRGEGGLGFPPLPPPLREVLFFSSSLSFFKKFSGFWFGEGVTTSPNPNPSAASSEAGCVCVRDSVQVAPSGAENTRWNIHRRHLCLGGHGRQFFGSWFSDVNGVQTERPERPVVEAPKKCPCPAGMCGPMKTAQSLWR